MLTINEQTLHASIATKEQKQMIGVLDFMLILGAVAIGLLLSPSDKPRWKL